MPPRTPGDARSALPQREEIEVHPSKERRAIGACPQRGAIEAASLGGNRGLPQNRALKGERSEPPPPETSNRGLLSQRSAEVRSFQEGGSQSMLPIGAVQSVFIRETSDGTFRWRMLSARCANRTPSLPERKTEHLSLTRSLSHRMNHMTKSCSPPRTTPRVAEDSTRMKTCVSFILSSC